MLFNNVPHPETLHGLPRTAARVIRAADRRLENAVQVAGSVLAGKEHPLHEINRHYGLVGLWSLEGYMMAEQAEYFTGLLGQMPAIKNIVEVGFNAGHSAYAFLNARPDTTVSSFDLGTHAYVAKGKAFIDERFPERHTLIRGNSMSTIPVFATENPDQQFDLIYIDGGHELDVAAADLRNCATLSHGDTVVVMDDYMPDANWGVAPTTAWDEAVASGGVLHGSVHSGDQKIWVQGRYRQQPR